MKLYKVRAGQCISAYPKHFNGETVNRSIVKIAGTLAGASFINSEHRERLMCVIHASRLWQVG